ncbi:MAG: glycosyltransferase family 2 protein [Acidobacteriota bacterium]
MIDLTALVLTFNEEPNIARTLQQLTWVRDLVLVDSNSTDRTREIAAGFPNVRVVQRAFTNHAEQWNFGLEQTGITTEWVLALDADFVLADDAVAELTALAPPAPVAGYRASFTYCIEGTPLRSAVYPPVTVLFRRAGAKYFQDGHTQRVRVDGLVAPLSARINHDDRKPLAHWVAAQVRYMKLEADKLLSTPSSSLPAVDRLRKWMVVMPPLMFIHCLFVGGGILDGRAGLFYALQRATAELILSLTLAERRLRG